MKLIAGIELRIIHLKSHLKVYIKYNYNYCIPSFVDTGNCMLCCGTIQLSIIVSNEVNIKAEISATLIMVIEKPESFTILTDQFQIADSQSM
jgi:hypothetical protein